MNAIPETSVDPRIRRTRQMLFAAFKALLEEKGFDTITVQDIAERSTVNRATFYDHFTDKFALLDAMIGDEFQAHIETRFATANGSCKAGLRLIILSVCDYLGKIASVPCGKARKQFEPMVEAKLKTMIRDFLAAGLQSHGFPEADARLRATVAGWAICGAALEWAWTKRTDAETFATGLLPLVAPTLACPSGGTEG